jgi:hypothetical protein
LHARRRLAAQEMRLRHMAQNTVHQVTLARLPRPFHHLKRRTGDRIQNRWFPALVAASETLRRAWLVICMLFYFGSRNGGASVQPAVGRRSDERADGALCMLPLHRAPFTNVPRPFPSSQPTDR